jgi:hypothetical protein
MDTLVLHDEDFDGWGARYAAWKHFGDNAEYLAIDHGKWQEEVPWHLIPEEPTEIYLLDYSWPLEDLFEIAEVHDLTVIDHHASFLSRIQQQENKAALMDELGSEIAGCYQGDVAHFPTGDTFIDTGRSFELCFDESNAAAVLTWRYFHQSEAPKLLRHIEDRDLWNWDMKHTDEVLLGLDSNFQSVEVYDRYADRPNRLLQAGTAIASYRDKLVARLVEETTIREAEVDGETYTFGIVNSPLLQSEIGNQIQQEYPEVDIALIFFLEDLAEETVVGASLRANDERPSVGELATFLGGGGHENSAGFGTETNAFGLEGTPDQLVLLN